MSALHFDADIDERKLTKKVDNINAELTDLARKAANSGSILDNSFKAAGNSADNLSKKTINVGNAMASVGALVSLTMMAGFAKEIANVRGEWQKYEAVLTNTLQSNQDAKDSLDMIAKYGAKTNFQVNELTDSFVKLASQGFKPTRDEMASLGDLAASKAKGFDQLTEAIIDAETFEFERLKEFGIRASKNGDQIQFTFKGIKTTVDASAESVRNYILSLGQLEGVKGSTDAISKTIVGLASNFGDAVNQMMNSIGKEQEGLIAGSIEAATEMVNNYEKVVDVIKVLIATYGTYKAASIAVFVMETYRAEMMVTKMILTTTGLHEATVRLTFAQWASAKAQGALNAVTSANIYVAAATAIAALVGALYLFSDSADEAADAQSRVNDTVNEQKAKIETLVTIINSETTANADRAKAIKEINDMMPDHIGFLDAQTLSTKQGKDAIDEYIKSIRKKAEMEQLTADLKKNLDEQDRIARGDLTVWEKFKGGKGAVDVNTGQRDYGAYQSSLIYTLKEQEDAIKAKMEATMAGKKVDEDAGKSAKTIAEQLLDVSNDLITAETKLKELRKVDSKATPEEIQKQEGIVTRLKEQKQILTGIKEDEKKNVDQLKKAQEELEKAVKSGDKAAITAAANKVTLLEKEEKKIKEIMDLELKREWRRQFDGQPMAPMTAIGIRPIVQVGSQKTEIDQATGKKILYEVTAIDNTGPVWKKVKAKFSDLKKHEKEVNEKGTKDQDKLDEKSFEKKKQFQEDLLNYSRQFTDELMNQMDLTEQESKMLSSFADTITNIASGNLLATAFSGTSFLVAALTGSGKTDPTIVALQNMNEQLEQQASILANLKDNNYLQLATKQYNDLGKSIDLTSSKLKTKGLLTPDQMTQLRNAKGSGGADILEEAKNLVKNWSADDFVEAYTKGTYIFDKQQTEWVQSIVDSQKQRAELIQETFREIFGFDASEVADSIFKGIDEGLKLSENNLGGFAQSFGELMKKALMQSVMDAMELEVTQTFLPKYKDAMADGILTEKERKDLEIIYAGLIKQGEIDSANIKTITDPYLKPKGSSSQNTNNGISASYSEETLSAMVGQTMAQRVDIKQISLDTKVNQDIMKNQLELMDQSLSVLNNIDRNTRPISRLENIENELKDMNRIMKEKL